MLIDDLASSQGDIALIIDYKPNCIPHISSLCTVDSDSNNEIISTYLDGCDRLKLEQSFTDSIYRSRSRPMTAVRDQVDYSASNATQSISAFAASKKRYKPVAKRTKPVLATLPEKFRILRNIAGDPLKDIPILNPIPPAFVPTGRYTQDCRDALDKRHSEDFLWPAERDLMHHFMCLQEQAFAWDDSERG